MDNKTNPEIMTCSKYVLYFVVVLNALSNCVAIRSTTIFKQQNKCLKAVCLHFNCISHVSSQVASLQHLFCHWENIMQPWTWQISQRFTPGKGFDRVLPLPVETLFHLWKEDYSQIPVPVWTKEADDGKLGLGFFCWEKEEKLLKANKLGGLWLFIMIYSPAVYMITKGNDQSNRKGQGNHSILLHGGNTFTKAPNSSRG